MATHYPCPKTKQTHGHTKQAPQMLPATSHGPSVRGAVKTASPHTHLPSACTHCQDRAIPFQEISQLVQQLASPQGIQLAPRGVPLEGSLCGLHSLVHVGLQGKTETVSLFRWPPSEVQKTAAVSCRGAKEGREAHSFKQQAFKSFG